MRFFIDTANVEDIRKANDMGVICGVTTNPTLIAKEGRDFNEVIKQLHLREFLEQASWLNYKTNKEPEYLNHHAPYLSTYHKPYVLSLHLAD